MIPRVRRIVFFQIILSFFAFSFNAFGIKGELQLVESKLAQAGQIEFAVAVPERCMFGDFDAVVLEMMRSPNDILSFSVSSPNQTTEHVTNFLKEVTEPSSPANQANLRKSLRAGTYRFIAQLPQVAQPELVVLSICKDSNSSCRDAKFENINAIIKQYQQPKKGFKPEDHVYFYVTAVLLSDKVKFFTESIDLTNREVATRLIRAEGVVISDQNLKEILDYLELVASVPILVEKDLPVISLPVYSRDKCIKNN